jgi:hypothetical protein
MNGMRRIECADAETETGMPLRIKIHDQNPVPTRAEFSRQIDRYRRFAGTAFTVRDR